MRRDQGRATPVKRRAAGSRAAGVIGGPRACAPPPRRGSEAARRASPPRRPPRRPPMRGPRRRRARLRRAAGSRARLPRNAPAVGAGSPRGGRGTLGFGARRIETARRRLSGWRRRRSGRPASPRRGLRTPGRSAGEVAEHASLLARAPRWASGLGGICSWSAIQRVFHRARRTPAPAPSVVTPGPRRCSEVSTRLSGPARRCARINAASRLFPLTAAETLDFRKYSGYDSNRRLRGPRIGNG